MQQKNHVGVQEWKPNRRNRSKWKRKQQSFVTKEFFCAERAYWNLKVKQIAPPVRVKRIGKQGYLSKCQRVGVPKKEKAPAHVKRVELETAWIKEKSQ